MAEKKQIIREKMEHSGVFDFKGAYSFAHSCLRNEDYDVTEEKYSETVSGNARNILFKWVATKTLSDYFKREIKIDFDNLLFSHFLYISPQDELNKVLLLTLF